MKDIRFFLQEFAKRHPNVRVAPMLKMNSDKEMYVYVVGKLEEARNNKDEDDSGVSLYEKYEFLASLLKSSVVKGGFPPDLDEFRRRSAGIQGAQKEREYNRAVMAASKW